MERIDIVDGPMKSTHKSAAVKAREEKDGKNFIKFKLCRVVIN